jgi:uncharacterized DUF497 family protein
VSADFDPKKDAANIKKHGVSLAEGDGVLNVIRSPLPWKTNPPKANSASSPLE